MGIKLFAFIRRAPGTTPAEFHAYWRDEHAAHIAGTPGLRRHLRRYELNHRLVEDYAREPQTAEVASGDYDGAAVMWFDSPADYEAFNAEPGFAEWRAVDAPKFRAPEFASVLTADPTVIVDTPRRAAAQAKLVCILRRNAGLDLDTFHAHWTQHHGGLFQNIAELRAPLLGYDQNHGIGGPDVPYDGVTEQWFEDLPHWIASIGTPANAAIVAPDVAYMLDPSSIHFVIAGTPSVIIGD
jgi:EthD domain